MKRWIERALNVAPGDLGRGTLLCSCLFLVMTTYKVGGVAGAALFLSRFPAQQVAFAGTCPAAGGGLGGGGGGVGGGVRALLGLRLGTTVLFSRHSPLVF